jgi:hypothetical protein
VRHGEREKQYHLHIKAGSAGEYFHLEKAKLIVDGVELVHNRLYAGIFLYSNPGRMSIRRLREGNTPETHIEDDSANDVPIWEVFIA